MSKLRIVLGLALGLGLGAAGEYWYAHHPISPGAVTLAQAAAPTPERAILYWRDPSGAPRWSATPAKDAQGRDFLPVYDDQEPSFAPAPAKPKTASADRRILYYRNPMGLPDTSPVPKKDSMGMDYIAVYDGDDPDDGNSVKISLDRVQRSGVRTEKVETHTLVQPVRAVGTVAIDESRQTIVTLRSDGFIEELFVDTTGRTVKAGEPLFRVYSPQIQQAQIDLLVAVRPQMSQLVGSAGIEGAMQRLRNLAVPEERIREVREKGANPRTIDWPAPSTGTVTAKKVINGQRVQAGDELYRIVDLTHVWVIADVAESDLALIKVGTPARVTFRAFPTRPVDGKITLVYPELRPETRTARVRIEVANPDGAIRTDMYADVMFGSGGDAAPVVAVPDSAVIDSGARQVVLVAKGEGRFEPRPVTLGRRGDGFREVLEGVRAGEEIVTTATFLIDAESNLKAALKTFAPETADRGEAKGTPQ